MKNESQRKRSLTIIDVLILFVTVAPLMTAMYFAADVMNNKIKMELAFRAATENRYGPYTRSQYYALLKYHGLLGDVAVLEERSDGKRYFKRNGKWCRFDRSIP